MKLMLMASLLILFGCGAPITQPTPKEPSKPITLTQSGSSTTINIISQIQPCNGTDERYLGGSVNPGAYGTWLVYASDPTCSGGLVTYQISSRSLTGSGLVFFGSITTSFNGGGQGGL